MIRSAPTSSPTWPARAALHPNPETALMSDGAPANASISKPGAAEVLRVFLKLGLTAFGGSVRIQATSETNSWSTGETPPLAGGGAECRRRSCLWRVLGIAIEFRNWY